MGAIVVRHDELLDEEISRHGGVRRLQEDENKGVVAAFTRASDAVAATLDVQRAFHCEGWPERTSVTLRLAMHTVQAQRREEGNYFGRAVNRCARLRAVAHGGQVVLATRAGDDWCRIDAS